MSQATSAFSARVNVVKKVKVDGEWKFCPVVVESSGRLRDRVRVNGNTETHPEGVYYIEWRDKSQRRRQAIPNRNEVLDRARRKALELESAKMGAPAILPKAATESAAEDFPVAQAADSPGPDPNKLSGAAGVILKGIESYLHGLISAALQTHLTGQGISERSLFPTAPALIGPLPDHEQGAALSRARSLADAKANGSAVSNKRRISEAIESFLKDIEPPQRGQNTYSQYRFVLHTFRDTCKKAISRRHRSRRLPRLHAAVVFDGQ
jgi:hypothetical protein